MTVRKSDDLVFHYRLARQADRTPDRALLREGDRRLSYAEVDATTNGIGRGLANLGVRKRDTVLVMLPSGIDFVLLWLGLSKIGAILVPINEAYRGNVLLHQVNGSAARLMVVHAKHLPRLVDLAPQLASLEHVVLAGGSAADRDTARRDWTVSELDEIFAHPTSALPAVVEYHDPMAIFYTSGTTGPSKGVLYGYAQAHATALPFARNCTADDVFYQFLPMHHVVLPNCFGLVLLSGAAMVIRERFSLNEFWPDVRRHGVTTTLMLGAIANFVYRVPAKPDDAAHTLRKVFMVPLLKELDDFRRRFDCEVFTWFNMTEVSTPIHSDGFRLANARSCGRVRRGVTARIVDEHDEPVATGMPGELVIRTEDPWELNLGYWRNPEQTLQAWRNLWFHTGDLFVADEDGNFYFLDRLKDAIRRRGENISSFEVEEEVNGHPAVLESAAVAVPSEIAEDEIKLVAVLKRGHSLSPAELLDYLQPRMPYHMVPRYVELVTAELPKTPTGKIQKHVLRATGTTDCWDREAAGYRVSR
jgi:carnitine-CoA ligase